MQLPFKQADGPADSVLSLSSSMTAVSLSGDAPSLSLSADHDDKQLLITVRPPSKPEHIANKDARKRASMDICCVIDVSGSMSSEALIPADPATNAPSESTGLSVLDVVKHALKTIIATMQDGQCDDNLIILLTDGSVHR